MIRPSNEPSHEALTLSPSRAHVRSTIANAVLQPEDLRELRLVHKALADVNRLRIVRRLAETDASVADLVEQVGLSQPLVSWHVGRLRAAGLVTTRRAGRETICRLVAEAFGRFATRQAEVLGIADES
ncbi:MAG TPA: metalloregulator ArsR/SmtB family transcription factor, partial [Candidatus Limnocylindrales bacterium]|nr:metalloregulator ArsR/SmtB family transcription factor [Candidatus Limnocylindrales bacterium]